MRVRFPSSSTIAQQLHRLFVTAMLAVALAALVGKAAHAQACGEPSDVPEVVFDDLDGMLDEVLPIDDEAICEKVVKAGVAACHKAVSDAASCVSAEVGGGIYKTAKAACAAQGSGQSDCNAEFKGQTDAIKQLVEADADNGHGLCDGEFAAALMSLCLGVPL